VQTASSLLCNRYETGIGEASVCQDDSTFSYCFVNNPDDCAYVAIDWDLFDQAKADFEGTIYGNLDLYIAETFFTCACNSGSPDCTQSTFATHNINACQDPAFQSISCETEDGIEKCKANVGNRSYQCTKGRSTIVGVESVVCCTTATAVELQSCVTSTITYDDFVNNPNPDPDLISCQVEVDGQSCPCNICDPQIDAISYDCSAVGRDDLIRNCPSGGIKTLEEFYNAKLELPFMYIDPLVPFSTPMPSAAPSLSQQPTMKNTPPPSPAPTKALTPPPTPAPTKAPTPAPTAAPTETLPSATPTLSTIPTIAPSTMPSATPTRAASINPTEFTPFPTETPSSSPTLEFMANCNGIHFKIQSFNEGYGDLECNDYEGDFPGVVYTCSATTTLTNGVVSLKVEPQEESRRRPFQRECRATAPDDLTFFCLDNVGANFNAFEVESARTLLDCGDDDDDEVYVYPQYNLLQGVDAESQTSRNFDSFKAENSFFVEFLGKDLSASATGGAASASASYSSTCVVLVATVLLAGVLIIL
jgi:hypothetical protein